MIEAIFVVCVTVALIMLMFEINGLRRELSSMRFRMHCLEKDLQFAKTMQREKY